MGWVEDKLEHVVATVTEEAERTRVELGATFASTLRGGRIDGARYVALSGAQPRPIAGAGGRLFGWSLLATAGPVRVIFHDGGSASGDVVGLVDLADQEHDNMWWGATGISFVDGLFMEVTGTGTALVGAVYLGAVD